ncbi:MAG: prolyl oligopeptidase family serine peptidase [Gemmatimonadales bacterium]|nr:prolyl oligopeptidase family serine peptidase [Gemmatimonadales bacterium]NIN11053.1 prolyl oligopeptidase family serine peptidase [Gemmatimonadales bacterium]NIN49650.1 prolyl oligopeptidase family serine peptidase [Gemmatimonadales bacterium]NIP07114.1 prolyl oligopeptidase family serine peptidase [Gemmatimonadales bacterium]NIQ99505.1 prolyl oligopeptidase family serine peptidase [Gemmatimonadales bacterium]
MRMRAMHWGLVGVGCAFIALATPVPAQEPDCTLPVAKKVDLEDDYHGTKVPDPYRWLEDVDADDTREWIEAQNCVTFAYLNALPQREAIRARLTELWDYPRYGTPFKEGGRYFFFKNDGLQNQSVLYMQETLEAEPAILLDPNRFSEDGTVALTTLAFSDDGNVMVYGTAASGSDWREFRVRDVVARRDHPDHLRWIKFSGASWTHDGAGFFYSRYQKPVGKDTLQSTNRNQKLYYHSLGTDQSEDVLVYERPDQPEWGFSGDVTDDGRYLVVSVWHGTDRRNRVYYTDLVEANNPTLNGPMVRLLDDFDASYSFVGNDGPVFYFYTDLDAPRRRLIAIDVTSPEREHWRELIPEGSDVLNFVQIVHNTFVANYLHDAHTRIALFAMNGRHLGDLELPTIGSVGGVSGERDDDEMFYAFTSYLYPTTIFRYDFTTSETSVFKSPDIDFDPSGYETTQVFYHSKDGTRIPMFITHRKGIRLDGSNPTYLYGYGGFNISLTPGFSISNLVWLEMGGVYAVPNLRGGGEYGEQWHRAGMLENKQNVFDDFVAAADFLIREGYTSTEKLAIGGASNGGLLVGAVLNQRPDLFGAALPAVGVMDMLRFHKFTIGWAWVSDYGSPDNPEHFPFIHAYSPLHNVEPRTAYPAVLITTADHDDRVVPGHSFKYTAALQAAHVGPKPVLIRIQTKAGHGAGKPTSMIIQEQADRWAFLVENLAMEVLLP